MPITPDILGTFSRRDLYQALIIGASGYTEAMEIFQLACNDHKVPTAAQKHLLLDVQRNHQR